MNESINRITDRDPFGLSALPPVQPPGDAWPRIAAALQRRRRRTVALAAAAGVTLALAIGWQLHKGFETPASGPGPIQARNDSVAPPDTLGALVDLSRRLEAHLRELRAESGAMPAELLVYRVELEDLIAQVDDAISRQPESGALWSQRVNLLLDLHQLYRQELRREQGLVASL